jgi:hypothetical protein
VSKNLKKSFLTGTFFFFEIGNMCVKIENFMMRSKYKLVLVHLKKVERKKIRKFDFAKYLLS